MTKPYIVGITGGSGSGKTVFLNALLNAFVDTQICLISQDNYYKPATLQPKDQNGVLNFDTPASIDSEALVNDLKRLKAGQSVQRKEYTFNNPNIVPRVLTFHPAPVIVVEGIFVLYFPQIVELIDLKIFIDAEEHIKLKRRITRDKVERGYDLEDVLYRYEHHVAPSYERFIKPYRTAADIIIPNNTHFETGLSVVIPFLKNIITQHEQ